MSDPDQTSSGPALGDQGEPGASVFGSLPRTRPAVRSPRRAASVTAGLAPETEEPDAQPRGREAEVEALARAGISFAGEAATLGFRIAGRAAAALRNAVERR